MIQRIQSLLLFAASILLAAASFLPIYLGNSNVDLYLDYFIQSVTLNGIGVQKNHYYLYALVAICAALNFYAIFLYKNRGKQIRITSLIILLICVLIGINSYLIYSIKKNAFLEVNENYSYGFILPLIALVFNIIAIQLIKKDEALVRSVDRIR
jgi:4-amino-4-deoxy-L-arabinose transferase-like glycosyltransferase